MQQGVFKVLFSLVKAKETSTRKTMRKRVQALEQADPAAKNNPLSLSFCVHFYQKSAHLSCALRQPGITVTTMHTFFQKRNTIETTQIIQLLGVEFGRLL